jgi:hypothetical protein
MPNVPVVAHAAIVRGPHGGSRAAVLIVAEPDPVKARELLRGKLPGRHVAEMYPLPSGCLEAFDLKPGQFTEWLGADIE